MAKRTPQSKPKSAAVTIAVIDSPTRRKGIHAKRGTAQLKSSKNYKKPYRGQGRSR